MTVRSDPASAGVGSCRAVAVAGEGGMRSVPERARELAGRLSVLFERDVELVVRLNDAHRRLHDANERLLCGLVADVHWAIHRAFCQYQYVCEERRQLAVDVGELAQQLSDVLCAAGWSRGEARAARRRCAQACAGGAEGVREV
ncbi:MAG: hypothetical protein ACLP01_14225 [Solirubrobacteraceae bacterium]